MLRQAPAAEWPELPVADARAALVELLTDERVELGSPNGILQAEEAVDAIGQDAPWTGESGFYELVITDDGVDLWNILVRQFWPDALT
jgi:hypothetical protein